MEYKKLAVELKKKKIALVAHDNKKHELWEWAKFNRNLLAQHELYATGQLAYCWRRNSISISSNS